MIRVKHRVLCPKDGRYYLVLDPAEIYPDDPGNGTPVMVYFDDPMYDEAQATYGCALGAGGLLGNATIHKLPNAVYAWLESMAPYVDQFLDVESAS